MNNEKIIYRVVCKYYKITSPEFLFGRSRRQAIVLPRHLFFDLCTKFTKLSLDKIGALPNVFGFDSTYDHATVLHAKKAIKKRLDTDSAFLESYAYMHKVIEKTIKKTEEDIDNIIDNSFDMSKFYQIKIEYEQKILSLEISHKKEIEKRESMNHPIFHELKNASSKHIDFFYMNRWKPYRKLHKI